MQRRRGWDTAGLAHAQRLSYARDPTTYRVLVELVGPATLARKDWAALKQNLEALVEDELDAKNVFYVRNKDNSHQRLKSDRSTLSDRYMKVLLSFFFFFYEASKNKLAW